MRSVYALCVFSSLVASVAGNNIPPIFDESEYFVYSLKEKAAINTPVVNVSATDKDNDTMTYMLGGQDGSKFWINNRTGEVFVNASLTKKEFPLRLSFEVFVYDDVNGPGHKTSANVYVYLVDINDNTPRFINEPYEKEVPENTNIGDIIFQVKAVDDDSGEFALISYKIISGNKDRKFAIATYTGHITVLGTLSFDEKTQYILNITATDGGGRLDNASVTIKIRDVDNLPAKFDARTYLASVREDAEKGFPVIQVSARDGDSLNASVEYLIDPDSNRNKLFTVDNATGWIKVNGSLDREKTSSYPLRIGAKSTYHSPVYITITIQVLDVNDNKPKFDKNVYEAFVPENSPVELTVLQVTATDADIGENATIQYILIGANDKFDIRSSGQIVVKDNIDREKKNQYIFVVTAQETLTPERYESNATVIINITDVNDHNPTCSKPIYNVIVDENQPNGTHVAQIIGVDSDAGKNAEIRYSMDSELDYFSLDPVSGNITTLKSLDRETKSLFTLQITLKDQATIEEKRTGSCYVQVTVADKNDNIPKFISLLNVTAVAEDATPGTVVVTIKALDEDVSTNAEVRYQIMSGNINDTFHLNGTSGVLTTTKSLDRETISQYNLVVNATDSGGMSQTDVVIITIADRNDNPPKFHNPEGYSFSVDENSAALLVGIVQASDDDVGKNAEIVYSIDPSTTSVNFLIEPSTGTIKTAVPLDREATDRYTLTVVAKDSGTPSLTTNVTVHINVSDVNDNVPQFSQEHYSASLAENEGSLDFLNLTVLYGSLRKSLSIPQSPLYYIYKPL
ncbi:cadherin EGF LAG seven-pass G-type receptor 1-like [Dendronephthya gigantea]|uniref:cadherin EGF LAG seven-pass G-type receptor 1-like n=1 Tax=Dendronephthya gigantea TaxID=151771 RepID=UPI00106C82B2|nr:cadherin EGF LAG seven-pass G-type receptor 1-like [Dendronephthya gigantea]